MFRRNIIKRLREVSIEAHAMESLSLHNRNTGEAIEFDPAFSSALICASLAYATVLIAGDLKHQEPEAALTAIITSASNIYVEEL